MPGKKRVEQPDEIGQVRIVLEQIRAENRLAGETADKLGRQQSLELRSLEARLGGRLEILEAVARSHSEELRGIRSDISGLDGKVDKLLALEPRVTALERREA
jgi:hypothetical protein